MKLRFRKGNEFLWGNCRGGLVDLKNENLEESLERERELANLYKLSQ